MVVFFFLFLGGGGYALSWGSRVCGLKFGGFYFGLWGVSILEFVVAGFPKGPKDPIIRYSVLG